MSTGLTHVENETEMENWWKERLRSASCSADYIIKIQLPDPFKNSGRRNTNAYSRLLPPSPHFASGHPDIVMAALKRSLEESPSQSKTKKSRTDAQKTEQPKPTTSLVAADVDFPRGGGTSFTPLEVKALRAEAVKEANAELFEVPCFIRYIIGLASDLAVSRMLQMRRKQKRGNARPTARLHLHLSPQRLRIK